jgi:hypothetical protein
VRKLADAITRAENQRFDVSRNVQTSEYAVLRGLTITGPRRYHIYRAVSTGTAV